MSLERRASANSPFHLQLGARRTSTMIFEELRLKGVQEGKPVVQVPTELWRNLLDKFERICAELEKSSAQTET